MDGGERRDDVFVWAVAIACRYAGARSGAWGAEDGLLVDWMVILISHAV